MAYIALKPGTFGGQSFKIGDTVPEKFLLPGAIKNLVKMGKIASADSIPANGHVSHQTIVINAHTADGDMPLGLTSEGLQQIFDALSANVEGAENIVANMTDGDALILLHICDNRKSVKAAAEARAKALEGPEAPTEEETDDSAGEE